jgi:AcrR family transcriptional regulator
MRHRAEQVERTRAGIVDAGVEVFGERGARGTTMREVAQRADVSPATVGNHFPTWDRLIEAVVERLLSDVDIPDASILAGARSTAARVRALAGAMYAFYDRTGRWYHLLGDEIAEIPALARANARYTSRMRALYTAALAGVDDVHVATVAAGLIHPATYGALREVGLSTEAAARVAADGVIREIRRRR